MKLGMLSYIDNTVKTRYLEVVGTVSKTRDNRVLELTGSSFDGILCPLDVLPIVADNGDMHKDSASL